MDEKTQLLSCLSAATAANCIPCFEYFFYESRRRGLTPDEIREAVNLAGKVNRGAHMAVKNSICDMMGLAKEYELPGAKRAGSACCG
jgi:alkylhydroperoxidase/carboxymuconolactone decarboxylase family protein YurZ